MLMRRKFQVIIIVVVLILFILIGYTRSDSEVILQTEEPQFITLMIAHGGSAIGSWLIFAEGIAEIVRKELPGSSITVIPGGSDANLAMLQRGEIELAITTTDSANIAVNGWDSFTEAIPLEDVSTIARLYFAKIQFVVLNSLGVNSFEEVKGEKVPLKISVGRRGSGMEKAARRILGEYGITFEDIENWGGSVVYFGQTESVRMLGDGQLNTYVGLSAVPMAALTELAMRRDFTILPIRADVIEKLSKEFDYTLGVIPAGAYKGLAEDMPTICVANGLFASGSLDEETAYLVTKALIDNIDRLRQIHSQISDITPEFMNQQMVFPLHSGAQRAYQK